MNSVSLSQLVPILQLSIGPVILISGVGLLLLTLTNRFGRMLDRTRQLRRDIVAGSADTPKGEAHLQIEILLRRASILRLSITLAAVTVLLDGVLMLLLFLGALLHLEIAAVIVGIYCAAVLSLIGSIGAFIKDMNLSMQAVRLEVKL